MESPERNLTITPAEVQGSPLFNFMCSLSPIKQAKSLHGTCTFSEPSFPPPPAVFVSPKVVAQKDSRILSREQSVCGIKHAQAGSETCHANVNTEDRQLDLDLGRTGQNMGCNRKAKDRQEKDASPCSSPPRLMEQYLSDPAEEELHSKDSSGVCMVSHTSVRKDSTIEPTLKDVDCMDDVEGCGPAIKVEAVASSAVSFKLSEGDGLEVGGVAGFGQKRTVMSIAGAQDSQGMDLDEETSSTAVCLNYQGTGVLGEVLELDGESSDLAFFLSERTDRLPLHAGMDEWQNQPSSSLSDLCVQHSTGYVATMREIVDKETQQTEIDYSTNVTTDPVKEMGEDVPGICERGAEPDIGVQQVGCRVGIPPQRGVRRRCLGFEVSEASKSSIPSLKSRDFNSSTSQNAGSDSNIPFSVLRERAIATSGATNSESTQTLEISVRTPGKADSQFACTTHSSGTSPVPVNVPSGIGLHLNSLAASIPSSQLIGGVSASKVTSNSASAAAAFVPLSTLKGSPSENFVNPLLAMSSGLQIRSTTSFSQGLAVVERASFDECGLQIEGSDQVGTTKSMTCFGSVTLELNHADENSLPRELEKKPSPLARKRVLLQDFPRQLDLEWPEDSSQSPHSPKRQRKSTSTVEKTGDGCKRCNCKKSKCLKLYCECFAAGVYCVDPCTCHDCFNKPEYENTVLETRQQIESRNPLAFASKIIRASESSLTNGQEEYGNTSASARHKRGCNCKRSQCLKKYCECYQAGVGCSEGCRCESCKNVYGRKGSEEFDDKETQVALADKEVPDEHIDTSDYCGVTAASQLQNNDLSPITPSFQHAGQSRSTVKLRSASKRGYLPDELLSPTFSASSEKLPKSPSRLLRSSKGVQNSWTAPAGMQLSKIAASPVSTPKLLIIGQFSPHWDGLGDICTLTPLPQAPVRPTAASVSMLDSPDSSPSFNEQHCNELSCSVNGSVRVVLKGSSPIPQHPVPQSSVSNPQFQTPVNVQRTPMTPLFISPLRAAESKIGHKDSNAFGHQCAGSVEDDSTPEFLKDPDVVWSPDPILKTCSPKQKRVSPPHSRGSREASNQGTRSPGLRNTRKFILQSIPSMPPTPFSAVNEQVNGNR